MIGHELFIITDYNAYQCATSSSLFVNRKRKTFAVATDWHFIIACPKCQNYLIAVKCLSVAAKCCIKILSITQKILPRLILTLCPHLFYQELLFLPAHHPDRQDYLHAKQHKEEQPHLQERELIWDDCTGKGFLTDFRTDCHGLLVKLPVIFEMHIGTVSCRVKSGPLRQSRFRNGNGT